MDALRKAWRIAAEFPTESRMPAGKWSSNRDTATPTATESARPNSTACLAMGDMLSSIFSGSPTTICWTFSLRTSAMIAAVAWATAVYVITSSGAAYFPPASLIARPMRLVPKSMPRVRMGQVLTESRRRICL
jgi:hypothetical protein